MHPVICQLRDCIQVVLIRTEEFPRDFVKVGLTIPQLLQLVGHFFITLL